MQRTNLWVSDLRLTKGLGWNSQTSKRNSPEIQEGEGSEKLGCDSLRNEKNKTSLKGFNGKQGKTRVKVKGEKDNTG